MIDTAANIWILKADISTCEHDIIAQNLVDLSIKIQLKMVATGSVSGAFGGSALGQLGQIAVNGALGFADTAREDWVSGEKSSFASYATNTAFGAMAGGISGNGVQHFSGASNFGIFSKSVRSNAMVGSIVKEGAKGLWKEFGFGFGNDFLGDALKGNQQHDTDNAQDEASDIETKQTVDNVSEYSMINT